MATETDIYPVGPTIDNANRLRTTQGLPPIGESLDEPIAQDAPNSIPREDVPQVDLDSKVNDWAKSYEGIQLEPGFDQINGKQAKQGVMRGWHEKQLGEVDALHDQGVPSEVIGQIRKHLVDQYNVAGAMIDAGDKPVTEKQRHDELIKRHPDLKDLPPDKQAKALKVYGFVDKELHSEDFIENRGHIARHMGLRDDVVKKSGTFNRSADETELELHKMANDKHWAITNILDSAARSAASLAAGVAGRRAQDIFKDITTAHYDPTNPEEVALNAAYRDFEQEMKQKYNSKADMTGQFVGMVLGGGGVLKGVKTISGFAQGLGRVGSFANAAAKLRTLGQGTLLAKRIGQAESLAAIGVSAANLASTKRGTTFDPLDIHYLKDFALESVKLAMLHVIGSGTSRLFSRSIVRRMAPKLQFNKYLNRAVGATGAGVTNFAGMRGMEVMEAAFGDSHKSFVDQLRDDWLGQMDYETLKRKGAPLGRWGMDLGLGAGFGIIGAWKGASGYADVLESYRLARERQNTKYRSGEWGFEAYNKARVFLDEAYTKNMKPDDRAKFLDDTQAYQDIRRASGVAETDISDAVTAWTAADKAKAEGFDATAKAEKEFGDTSALIAQQKLMTALAKQKAKKKAAMEEKMLRGETPTEETKPSEPTTPAPHPIIAQIDSVVAAHASELSSLGHPAELVLVTIPDESGGGGLQFNQKIGKIEYDPVRIEKLTIGMTPRQRAKYIQRGIAEEIIHVATDKYASESPENQAKLRAILGDAEAVAAAKKAYGENAFEKLNETQKAFEVARVLIQGPRALTEAAYRFFKDFLRWLAQKVKNLSPETKELLDGIKAKMEAHKSGKVEEATPKVVGDANYKPEPAKESEPKNEKAQSVPSVQKADESVRLPQAEVTPAAPSPEPVTPAAASHAQTAKEWESANKRKLPQNRAPIPESLSLPVGTVVRAKNYGENEGDIVITGPLRVNTSGIIEYPADFTGSGRMASVEANEITEIKPAAAKPVEAERNLAPLTEAERSLAESLAKKYGMPVLPAVQAKGEIENLSRFSNMLERAADKSNDETELAQILSAAKGRIDESRIANAVANNPHSSEATFSEAKANSERQKMAGDESIAYLNARRAELRKQRGLDAQPAAAPAAEQPAPAPIEQAIADANWRGTVREVPAPRSMGGEGVKLYIPVDASGKDVSVGGQTILGKTPAEAIELAQKNAKPAPAPVAAPTKGRAAADMTPEQRQEQAQVIRDMMATNRENKKPIPQGWVNRLAELEGAPKPQEGEIYSNIVEGHPQHEASHAELRNLIPIKITSSEQLTRPGGKFDQAQALLDKWNKQIGTLEYQSKSAKTPALRKKAAAELSKLGAERAARDTLRDVIIPELNRLNSEALKREPVTPSSPAPVAGAKTRLDLMLDGVERTGKELTIEVTDANRDNLTKIIETAEKRGLRASTDGQFVLIRPAAAPAATPQAEGGIFGYAWADIRSKQQGGKLAALIRGNAPKATESDFAVLEKHGMDWLYENGKHSIIDRLGLPVDKPSKKAAVKPAAIPKIIDVTETPGAQVSGPRLAIKLDDGTIIHSADAGIHAVLAARAGIDPSRIVDTGFYGVLSGEFKGGKTTTAPTKSTLAPSPVSEAAKLRAKLVEGATVEVTLRRGSGAVHPAKLTNVDTERGVATVEFKKSKSKKHGPFKGGETQDVRLDQVAPLKSVRTRMLNEAQFEGMTEDQKRQTKADAKEFDNLVADHPEMNWYNWRVNDLAGTKSGDMDIAAERKRASEEAMKEIGGDRPGLHPDNSIMKAELLPKLKAMIEEKAHELAREIPEDSLPSDTDFLPPGETPEPVAPKLRPSDGKGTGELLQGDAAPFNLVAETAADIAKREAREAAEQIAKDAKDAAEAKAKQDKEQGNLFGVATPRMGQELADKADALGIPLKTEQIKKLIADDPDTLREVRARIDRETGGEQAGMVRTANPLENRDERSTPFYSALTKTVQALPQETMTVQQARAAIEKGAKKDEIAMSGILTDPLSPLAGKQPGDKVTKAELTGYALERQATVQDYILGDAAFEATFAEEGADGKWHVYGERASEDDVFDTPAEANAKAAAYNRDIPKGPGHFSQYQLPGADEGSYREMFVTWPNRAQQNVKDWTASRVTTKDYGPMIQGGGRAVWEIRNKDGEYIGSLPQADYVSGDEAIAAVASKGNLSLSESRKNWNDGHPEYSDIANPIVRIRRNIRTDADGKRTYFIEEMQGPGKGEQEKMPPELRKRIYEIGMKRALRDAVDEGVDAIAWTTGAQQIDRYEEALRQNIDRLEYEPYQGDDGKPLYEINGVKAGKDVFKEEDVTPERLAELVGKDLAAKIEQGVGTSLKEERPLRPAWMAIEGKDLSIGGQGLKRLYDATLPGIANDLAKKFGVKVGTAEIRGGEKYILIEEPSGVGNTFVLRNKDTGKYLADSKQETWALRPEDGELMSESVARKLANRFAQVSAPETVHSLPIPDALKTQQRGGNTIFTANPADSLRETSTKNAVVDEERAKLGLDPIMSEIRQSHPVVWDAAMRALERDPMAGQNLVNEINGSPRTLTPTEEAIILRHKINTQTAFYREMEVANDGNASPQDRMSAKLYAAQHLDAMNEIDNATRKSGTEWGRLGAFRQRLAREDYTLVAMLRKRSMATGERIEPGGAEYQFVEKLNKRIAELEAKATQDARNHAAELEQLRETAMEDAMQKMRSDGTPAQKKEREILARIAANMESAKENADAALREMGFGPVANAAGPSGDIIGAANPQDANTLDPKVLKLLSVGGANHLRKLGNDRAKWDEAMLSNYGPKVQPHLDAVWDVSQATLNDFIDGQAPKETRENTKKKILTDAEKQKRILDSIRRKSATPDKVAPYLKQLAKQLVSQGVSDRWTLLTTMETMLKDILPDATRSEIRDSLADYGEGKYRELSTDEVSVKMRRLRAQLQQEAKIEDMMRRGELPWLIGSERGEPDAETRTMIKEVNEIKKELGLEATNENQGKSARAAIKTRLRNEIEELEKFIKTRERIPSNRRSVEDDPETAQLRRDVRELRAKYQEIVGVDTMAEEAAKKSALEKSIADLQNQIVTGEIEQAAKQQTVDTPEIAALKAQKAALLEQRKAMRSPSTEDIERKKEQALLDRITKLSARIATGVADTKVGKPTVESANVSAYRDIIKDLNKQLAEIRNPKKSPEQTKLDELDKRIAEVSAKIARGDLSAKQGKPTVDTAEQAVRKDTLRALNKQLADMRKAAKPTLAPDEIALKTWKTRAEKRLIDLKDRTARGDFSKKVRKVMPMDTEALKTKAALEAAKLEFDQANHKAMTANAPWWVKTMDVAQKYRRWAVLTSATVFEKLGMAAVWRTLVFQPIEDATGSIIRHIPFIKQVAAMAPRHGQGFNTRIQLDGLIKGFASGASEAATHLKKSGNLLTGSKALSWLFGEMDEAKRLTQTPMEMLSGKRKVEPDTAWEIPGVLHAVVKDIPKMVEFHKSVAFRTKWYADRGVDVSDPLMQEKIQIESFQDAMRAISMQENAVLNKLNRFIRSLGEPDAKTGKVNKWGKVWQTAFKVAFPIVKIPTNIVAEAFEYVAGFPAGLLNVRKAIKDGITNLQPEHADMIMRQLKKGLVGNAIFLTGFLLASNIGGYFQHGRKRDPDEVPAGGIRIGDTTVHERALHAPALLILQAGATIARVMNSRLRKSDVDEQGLGAGLVASAMGLADEIPFVKEAFNLSALRNPYQKSHWFGAKARSIVEPTLMQWIAKLRDTDEEGNPIKRQADGFVDEMKMGIPGLRETLDVKQEKVPHARSHRR